MDPSYTQKLANQASLRNHIHRSFSGFQCSHSSAIVAFLNHWCNPSSVFFSRRLFLCVHVSIVSNPSSLSFYFFLRRPLWLLQSIFCGLLHGFFKAFLKSSFQAYPTSGLHQASTLSLRGGVRDMLTRCNRPKPNPSSIGFSLLCIPMLCSF